MSAVKHNIQIIGNSRYVDLFESKPDPGTPVIAWTLDNQTTGNLNQQVSTSGGENLYTIRAANPPCFAYVSDPAGPNTQVIGHNVQTNWVVTPRETSNAPTGSHTIRLPNTNLVWTATSDNKIFLRVYDANDKNQQFTLKLII
ncbi:hypothetical protein L218DRAFT_1005239 [Marasmius fiardii PR-910]|nr:hypothetical protein L218DRAFT_1005239 [Marasmius fiardii PR-910]